MAVNYLQKIYQILVNRDDDIKKQYTDYRKTHPDNIMTSAAYLVLLNARKHIHHANSDNSLHPDIGRRVEFISESEQYKKDINQIIETIRNHDVISFDIFDTLILRKVAEPSDVFFLIQEDLRYPGLARIRVDAEKYAREKKKAVGEGAEVSIEEIWKVMEEQTGIPCQRGINSEWKSELNCCYANPFFTELFKNGCLKGKKVVACSDMYWGSDKIIELLSLCGFPEFEDYFISCDLGASKSKGELFDEVKNSFPGLSVLHIGDNLIADIRNAKKRKIDAIYYPKPQEEGVPYRAHDMSPVTSSLYSGIVNNYLHNGIWERTREFELGFIYGGLLVTGFCQFIHKYAEENNIEKILFLARDGDVLKKAYDRLYPENNKSVYFLWSRLAGLKAYADNYKSLYLDRMIRHKVDQNYTVEDCFTTMEISDMLPVLTKEAGIMGKDKLSRANMKNVLHFIRIHWDQIVNHYSIQKQAMNEYIQREIGDARSVAVVDIGWVGSGYFMLKEAISGINKSCEVKGLLAGTAGALTTDRYDTITELSSENISCYVFSPMVNREIWKAHDVGKNHNLIMEILLSSSKPSLRSFKGYSEDFEFSPMEKTGLEDTIQAGILEFIECFRTHPFSKCIIPGSDAYAPIALIKRNEQFVNELIEVSKIKGNLE